MPDDTPLLINVHDPMCSWCYAFRPTWDAIVAALPPGITVRRLLGGLAPDSDAPMAAEMRAKLEGVWQHIQQVVPGTEFNFSFWRDCTPRRSTYRACRAVLLATAEGGEAAGEAMIRTIQDAYYRQARNPSDSDTLVALAAQQGLDADRFAGDLDAPQTRQALDAQIARARQLGANGFPTLLWLHGGEVAWIRHDYRNPQVVLDQVDALLVGRRAG